MSTVGPPVHISVLGELQVKKLGKVSSLPPSRKTRALLAYLAVTGRPQRREKLCELFWDIPDDPRGSLRWSLSKIRTAIRADDQIDPLEADRNTVLLLSQNFELDCARVMNLGPAQFDRLDTSILQEVADLFRGKFLEDLSMPNCKEYEAWRISHADVFDITARKLFRTLVDRNRNFPVQALPYLHALQRLDPEDENLSREAESLADAARKIAHASSPSSKRTLPVSPLPSLGSASENSPMPPAEISKTAEVGGTLTRSPTDVRFCTARDGVRLAYAVNGSGPPLVRAAHWMSHLNYDWESPIWRHWIEGMQSSFTLLRYDERCNGLSDWTAADVSFETLVDDLEAVVDAAGLERFALLGISQGCAVSVAYAIRHPHRVTSLVLYGGYAQGWRKRGDPREIAIREALGTLMREGWGQDNPMFRQLFTQRFVPGASAEQMSWFNDLQRQTVSPENAWRLQSMAGDIDVVDLLPRINVPTLVMQARGDAVAPFEAAKEFATGISGARFVPLDSENHILLSHEPAFHQFLAELKAFTTKAMETPPVAQTVNESKRIISVLAFEILHPSQECEDVDPESTAKTLDPLMSLAEAIVESYGGVIAGRHQFQLTAAFGADAPAEDHARQACLAALAAQRALKLASDTQARVKIGIDTGEIIVRRSSHNSAKAIDIRGAASRFAWRIVHDLLEGAIVLTARSQSAAGGYIVVRPLDPLKHNSFPSDQQFFEVLAENRGPTRWHLRANQALTPLIGRDSELRFLAESWQRAQSNRGKVVAILGEPGVGKSRLCNDFLRNEAMADVCLIQGGALESDASMAYGLLKKLLKSLFGIAEDDNPDQMIEAINNFVKKTNADPVLLPPFFFALDLPIENASWAAMSGPSKVARLSECVRAAILLTARVQPLILLAEDLHWVDQESQAVLARLCEDVEAHPVLVIFTARPQARSDWINFHSASLIRLEALGASTALSLAQNLLGGDESVVDLANKLAVHTGGVPLFLEETVRMMAQAGFLTGTSGNYCATSLPESIKIPPTVQSMISTRINSLSPVDRNVLETAAIIGTEVPSPVLRRAVELSSEALDNSLSRLRTAQFLIETRDYPNSSYSFRHALVHTTTIQNMLKEQRKLLEGAAKQLRS